MSIGTPESGAVEALEGDLHTLHFVKPELALPLPEGVGELRQITQPTTLKLWGLPPVG